MIALTYSIELNSVTKYFGKNIENDTMNRFQMVAIKLNFSSIFLLGLLIKIIAHITILVIIWKVEYNGSENGNTLFS